jgi:hypothetical protein
MATNRIRVSAKTMPVELRDEEPEMIHGGLLVRRERWCLTWPGRFLVLMLTLGAAFVVGRNLRVFLAVDHPTNSDVLVVEGWMSPAPMAQAAKMINEGHYRIVITSGCQASDEWGTSTNETYAQLGAMRLARDGVATNLLQAVPAFVERKDRTYHSALAVKEWLETNHVSVTSIDLVTLGPHARRSRLLYEKAFGGAVAIGVIPMYDPKYDPARWWTSSEGVRDVLAEGIAYLYARFFFFTSSQ